MEHERRIVTTPLLEPPMDSWIPSLVEEGEVHELRTSRGRPVWIDGCVIGTVYGEAGEELRVLCSRSGRWIIDRDLQTGWTRDRDVIILDPGDEERLFNLIGYGPDAMEIYARLGLDPTLVIE